MSDRPEPERERQTAASNLQAGGDINIGNITQYINPGNQVSGVVTRLTRQEQRFRQVLLNKVSNYWVKGVLETSLHNRVLIELNLEERLDAVHPWGMVWETPDQPKHTLPTGTRVSDKFNQMGAGRSILILGEPGAGKTTTLLELTRDLIAQAELDTNQPIPVVFNLSSWADKKLTIADWLVQELHTKYQVSRSLGRAWVKEQKLLLLLDGLDEVKAKCRESCVQALNRFIQLHGQTEIILCSRIKDYEALDQRLRLQVAIYLQPLTTEQVNHYLVRLGAEFATVRAALQTNAVLQELAKTPLMLSIIVLAYQGMSVEALPNMNLEQHRQHLFDAYIQRMFFRRRSGQKESQHNPNQGKLELTEPEKKALHCLVWLAQRMTQESQTVFFIERMQPYWLQPFTHKWIYRLGIVLIIYLLFVLSSNLFSILIVEEPLNSKFNTSDKIINALTSWRVLFLSLFIVLINWIKNREKIKPVETLKWSWKKARNGFVSSGKYGFIVAVVVNPIIIFTLDKWNYTGAHSNLKSDLLHQLLYGLLLGILFGAMYGLVGNLTYRVVGNIAGSHIKKRIERLPHESMLMRLIWKLPGRLRHRLIRELIVGLVGGLLLATWLAGLLLRPERGPLVGLVFWLTCGLIVGLTYRLIVGLTKRWHHRLIPKLMAGLIDGLVVGVVIGVIFGLIAGLIGGLISGLMGRLINVLITMLVMMVMLPGIGLTGWMIWGLIGGLANGLSGPSIATKTFPNQGIWNSTVNTGKLALIGGLISGVIYGLIIWRTGTLPDVTIGNHVISRWTDTEKKIFLNGVAGALPGVLAAGIPFGLSFGLIADAACIQHLSLRVILYFQGAIPWNYARFLDYATERCFLQKVGGGYIFVHRLLLEHFAALEPERVES